MEDLETLATTRRSLHAVAESVIAGPQYRAHGTIRMAPVPGGFGGTVLPVSVEGIELVWAGGRAPIAGATCASLGALAGVDAGPPASLYHDHSGVGVDDELQVDAATASELAAWFALGDRVLRSLDTGADPVLWPEHFDLAVTVGDASVGVSPGDGYSAEPYAYVSVAEPPAGVLWNAPFGASMERSRVHGAEDLVEFFARVLRELA